MPSSVTHFEIFGDEPEKLADFYRQTLGWQLEKLEGMAYWNVSTDAPDGPALRGGLTYRAIPGLSGWLLHVQVEALDETVERIVQLGGSIVRPKAAIPRTAWVAVVADPAGNIFGLWQPDARAFPVPMPD